MSTSDPQDATKGWREAKSSQARVRKYEASRTPKLRVVNARKGGCERIEHTETLHCTCSGVSSASGHDAMHEYSQVREVRM